MVSWLKSPRGSLTTALAVAVVLALLWLYGGPRVGPSGGPGTQPLAALTPPAAVPPVAAPSSSPAASSGAADALKPAPQQQAELPPAAAPSAATPSAATPSPAPQPAPAPAASSAALPAAPAPSVAADAPATVAPVTPSFDIVRVEPNGETVIAGRAEPGSTVDLVDDGAVVAHIPVDPSGQFALLPPALKEGSHYLTLQTTKPGQSKVLSSQSVAVSVAKGGTDRPLVALLTPDQPARVLSDGSSAMLPAPGKPAAKPAGAAGAEAQVAIQSVEVAPGGQFTASGIARPGSQSRLYLNGAYLADVTAGRDGKWSLKIGRGMQPGQYAVRADEIDPKTGSVLHRAEVPFDYPATLAQSGGAKQMLQSREAGARLAAADPVPVPATPGPTAVVPAVRPPTGAVLPNPAPSAAGSASKVATAAQATAPAAAQMVPPASPSPEATTQGKGPGTPAPGAPARVPAISALGGKPPVALADAGKSATDGEAAASDADTKANAVVPDLQSARVVRGDSLWRISRRMLGRGIKYTEIYASNVAQIRDPALIYPGQIFVVPNRVD